MSAQAFTDGMRALLGSDATLAAAVTTLIGAQPIVLRGNQPLGQIPAGQFPCWFVDQGPGRAAPISEHGDTFITIGSSEQQFESDVLVALVWKENDRERAADQRAQLPALLTQLMLRNPQPGGIVGAWLSDWTPDRAALHPTQLWTATVHGIYAVTQST